MAQTILERPIGVILGDCVDASINEDYNNFATVNSTAHGLSDNNWVYIQSNIEDYNGFWQIDVINSGEFALRNPDGTYVPYIQDADITYCPQIATHGWSCVHLPITYRISNNRYPTNSVDTARTVSTLANNNGFVQLGLSGSLGTFEDLSFVKISGSSNSNINGVWQILDKLSSSSVILNIPFSSVTAATIIGATVQLYYGNYNTVVEVYAGINASHQWASVKPYELVATLYLTPDSNNEVFFSIADLLKDYVKTENNLLLGTLPNNTDFWTNFYIKTSERYDSSNGYSVTSFQTGFETDTFEGTAVNAKLAFKNIHSGSLSEYLMTNTTAKFLTLFTIPVLFACGDDTPDCYSDISFILPEGYENVNMVQEYYSNGVLGSTIPISVWGSGDGGLFRVAITPNCSYDRLDVSLVALDEVINTAFSSAEQESTADVNWTEDGVFFTPTVSLTSGQNSEEVGFAYEFRPERVYDLTLSLQRVSAGGSGDATIFVRVYSAFSTSFSGLLFEDSFVWSTLSNSVEITVPSTGAYLVIQVDRAAGAGSYDFTVIAAVLEGEDISETKTFDIECGCSEQEIRLSWLNNLGGMEPPWAFTSQSEHAISIDDAMQTIKNIFPLWPKSYGAFADTIRRQTSRISMVRKFIVSQHLTQDQADAIAFIKSSPLVQIVNSRQDRRTVIVDTDSFVKYTDGDKLFSISFNIIYTDDIPSQTV